MIVAINDIPRCLIDVHCIVWFNHKATLCRLYRFAIKSVDAKTVVHSRADLKCAIIVLIVLFVVLPGSRLF